MPFDMLEAAKLKLGSIPEIEVVHLHVKDNEFDAYNKVYLEMYQNHDVFLDKLGKTYMPIKPLMIGRRKK